MPQSVKPNNNPAKADPVRGRFDPVRGRFDPVRDKPDPDRARGHNAPAAALAGVIHLKDWA